MVKPLLEFERGKHYDPIQQWKDFQKDLLPILVDRNRDIFWWESPEYTPGQRIWIKTILDWFDESFATDLARVKVYPFRQDGLRFDFELQTMDPRFPFKKQLHIIKACKTGFHRDWKRNGICVQTLHRDLPEPPFDLHQNWED